MKRLNIQIQLSLEKFSKTNLTDSDLCRTKLELLDIFSEYPDKTSLFIPPSHSEISIYITSNKLLLTNSISEINEVVSLFFDYYESVGWVVGKSKKQMKSWKKALNNWCKRNWTSSSKSKMTESIKAHILIQKQIS